MIIPPTLIGDCLSSKYLIAMKGTCVKTTITNTIKQYFSFFK